MPLPTTPSYSNSLLRSVCELDRLKPHGTQEVLCASYLVNSLLLTRSTWVWIAKATSSEVVSVTLRCLENTALVTESPLIYPTHQTRTSDHSKVVPSHTPILTLLVILPLTNLFMPFSSEFLKVTHTYDMHTDPQYMPSKLEKNVSPQLE